MQTGSVYVGSILFLKLLLFSDIFLTNEKVSFKLIRETCIFKKETCKKV